MIDPKDLLISANAGDKDAYNQLLQWLASHAKNQIKTNLRNYTNFPVQAFDDIIQDVLITFHNTHQTFDLGRPLLPWINAVIKNKAIDFIRKKEFRVTMSSIEIETIKELWPTEEEEKFETEQLLKILDRLPEDQCSVLKMAKVEGFSGKEIAQKLNLSESNVKVLIHRGIKQMKKLASLPKYKE